jgi:hypothetical protein
MSWTSFSDDKGQNWVVDQTGLWIFVRQFVYAQLLLEKSRINKEHNWIGPDLVTVETDFAGIRAVRDQRSFDLYATLELQTLANGKEAFNNLVLMRGEMDDNSDNFKSMQRNASRETMQNINTSVSRGQTGLEVATVVRDLSASTLVVGATFLSGGAAFGVLGAGSALKGTARYQDSGNIGSAVLEASGTFVVGMITMAPALGEASQAVKLGAKVTAPAMATSQRVALVVVGAQVDATFEGAKSAMEGGSAKEALAKGATRFVTDIASGGTGIKLDKMALPVVARLVTDTAGAVISDTAGNLAANKVKPPVVPAKLVPVRDCNPVINGATTDEDYVRALVLRPA